MPETILSIENLSVSFKTHNQILKAVRGVNLDLKRGETLAIVGESGSGKSVTAKSIMKLLPKQKAIYESGSITYEGEDLLHYSNKEMEQIRGKEISMVFQDPMTSLNPTMKVGKQVVESLRRHTNLSKKEAYIKAEELLKLVGIPQADERMKFFPHEFSGGMRQRVVIAMALACDPKILIADEPTTALDVTIQAQILNLMKSLQKRTRSSIIIITHDLGVVVNMADRVAVMYGGKIVETGTLEELFYDPQHPYTWGLLQSMPKMHQDRSVPLIPIAGSPPDLNELNEGCPFAARCPYVMKVCHDHPPENSSISEMHTVSCWLQDERSPKVERPVEKGDVPHEAKTY